ncbi:hypothetical protein [Sphingosinithalassobacter portus]|uniref:hypothetical protein n=1 Tax=Stakelama portus TaxID=2676234 RepID=UPI000D6DE89A|nr:hypothetical protein [Sphingosinithalassobacter portus]
MVRLLTLIPAFIAVPALAYAPHSGEAGTRTMPQLSDIALVVFAAGALWFVRHAMRRRKRKQDAPQPAED